MIKRELVYKKSNGKCAICGIKLHLNKKRYNENEYTQIDHIIPRNQGGTSRINNIRALCKSCNSRRSNRSGMKLLGTIYTNIEESSLDYNDRHIWLQDDINNGILTKEHLSEILERMESVFRRNKNIIESMM